MKVHLTEEQARRYGFVKGKRPTKNRAVERGPYQWRCNCGETGSGEAAATRHVGPGHNQFATIFEASDG